MENVQIIILAGGRGTRMESDGPKALTLLHGKSFLQHMLDTVSTLGLAHKPIIVVGYQKEKIMEAVDDAYHFAPQEEQLGTGHAVAVAEAHVKDPHDIVVVLYADHPLISADTILKMIEKQKTTGAKVVITPTDVPDYEDWRKTFLKWGRIKRDKNRKISGIVEYKDTTEDEKKITEIVAGYFAFDAHWLWENLKKLNKKNIQNEYYLTDLVNIASSDGQIVECVNIPPKEAIGANSKEELEILERITV